MYFNSIKMRMVSLRLANFNPLIYVKYRMGMVSLRLANFNPLIYIKYGTNTLAMLRLPTGFILQVSL